MHLNRLKIRNFKKYRAADIEFQDGLTGIVGGNGTGKSTIVEAIAWALYGSKASIIKRELIKNARARENDAVEVNLSLGIGKHDLSISRGMRGRNLAPEASLSLDGRTIASGSREVDLQLDCMLKISFQDFMKTFYARQKDLDNLLKEGGSGKREYLLKLLGLEEIREHAIETMKLDIRTLEDQTSRIEGALANLGEVEAKMEDTSKAISSAREELERSKIRELQLTEAVARRRLELELQSEKRRTHDLLIERISGMSSAAIEKKKAVKTEKNRLASINASKRLLFELDPQLRRFEFVKARIKQLEPLRKEYDGFRQRSIKIAAELAGSNRLLEDSEKKLYSLLKDKSSFEEIAPKEIEYQDLLEGFGKLEALRDQHAKLQTQHKGESVRLASNEANLAHAEAAIIQLMDFKARIDELQPLLGEHSSLQAELLHLNRQRDLKKDLERLEIRKKAVEARLQRLNDEKKALQRDLHALGNLESREAELRKQDMELDRLMTDLDRMREDFRSDLKVQESVLRDSRQSLSRVKDLGDKAACPTCERSLGDQYLKLLKKYEMMGWSADQLIDDLKGKIQSITDKINGVIASRSSLKKSFDEFYAAKSKRSEIMASIRSNEAVANESLTEFHEIVKAIDALGPLTYDASHHSNVQESIEKLAPFVIEYQEKAFRLQDLSQREAELETLKKEKNGLLQMIWDLSRMIEELGYSESEYLAKKKMLSDLKAAHDRFIVLSQRMLEIPEIELKIQSQKAEMQKLETTAARIQEAADDLDYDPVEHEELVEEGEGLLETEEKANRIKLEIEAEPEITKRLEEAAKALADLEAKLNGERDRQRALDFRQEQHEATRQALAAAEESLEGAGEEVSQRQIQLEVLQAEMERLGRDVERKKEYRRQLVSLGQRQEVVDAAKYLVNKFMDHILLRIKNEIAKSAGDILEAVSGKYGILKIDDDFSILVEDGGEFFPIHRYSGGEMDMIAVSVRVAISEYLMRFCRDGPGCSFLILDEIFGSQDIEHREKMINMLRSLEERFPQIIAISHFSDVQGQFDNTIQVLEDEVGNSRINLL